MNFTFSGMPTDTQMVENWCMGQVFDYNSAQLMPLYAAAGLMIIYMFLMAAFLYAPEENLTIFGKKIPHSVILSTLFEISFGLIVLYIFLYTKGLKTYIWGVP